MRWTFSDGTTVELGGKVSGDSAVAQRLRADLERPFSVQIWAHPSEPAKFDANDAALVEVWLRADLDFWTRIREVKLKLKSPKGIPALPPPPWADEPDDSDSNIVY